MKVNKRIITAFLALAVIFCMSVPAFAETNTGEAGTDGSVSMITESATYEDETSAPEDMTPPVKGTNSNAPFFAGAVIAVLVFAGVAVFCRVKGNR